MAAHIAASRRFEESAMKAENWVAIAMLLSLGPITAVGADETLAGVSRAGEPYFNSNGVKIHYTDEGQGEPVLLIHGFAADIVTNWGVPGIRKALAKEYRVIAIDNRGHGKSDKPHDAAKYGMEMVEDAVRLLDHLKIKKAHVIGYSMGGIITLKLAATHPERLRSATLGGAGWMREPDLSADKIANALDKGGGDLEALHR